MFSHGRLHPLPSADERPRQLPPGRKAGQGPCLRTLVWSKPAWQGPRRDVDAQASPPGLQRFTQASPFTCEPGGSEWGLLGSWSSPEVRPNSVPLSVRRDLPCQHSHGQGCRSPASLWDSTGHGCMDGRGWPKGPSQPQDLSICSVPLHPAAEQAEPEEG